MNSYYLRPPHRQIIKHLQYKHVQSRNRNLKLNPNPNSAQPKAPILMSIHRPQNTDATQTPTTATQSRDHRYTITRYATTTTKQYTHTQPAKQRHTLRQLSNTLRRKKPVARLNTKLDNNNKKKLQRNETQETRHMYGKRDQATSNSTPSKLTRSNSCYFAQIADDKAKPSRKIASDKYALPLV